jgi:hypothetical protein
LPPPEGARKGLPYIRLVVVGWNVDPMLASPWWLRGVQEEGDCV